jgi:hypothetical protein
LGGNGMTRSRQVGAALALCLIAYWGFQWWSTIRPLPPIEAIVSMEARIFRDRHTQTYHYDEPFFPIAAGHWPKILAAMQPARRDQDPAKWAGLGLLRIRTNDGRTVRLELYETDDGPGAFSVYEQSDSRVYYRGGDTEQLRQALYDAQASDDPVVVPQETIDVTAGWSALTIGFAVMLAVLLVLFLLYVVGAKSDQKLEKWRARHSDENA